MPESKPSPLARLNPFRGLPNPKEVWAWGMYDFANQSFTLLIITLLFSLYVQSVVTPQPELSPETLAWIESGGAGEPAPGVAEDLAALDEAQRVGKWNWSLIHGSSYLIVVLLSPFVGALADLKGWRKQFLVGTGFLCCALTASLAGVRPGMLWLAALLYIPANVCYQIGENFLASFLPGVSTPRTIGRISAIGWTMGYLGALGLLVCSLAGMLAFGWKEPSSWQPFFVFAAAWFLLGMLPPTFILKNDTPLPEAAGRRLLPESVSRVVQTFRHASRYAHLMRFLLAFFVYGFGVQVIIGFASIIAGGFGFGQEELILFVAQITVTAGLAAAGTALFQDRIGARATVIIYLFVWLAACLGLIATKANWPSGGPQWPLWIIGNLLGFGLGGIGTASRSMVARFAPAHRTAEFFGLWGLSYKLAAAIGVLAFGGVARLLGDLASLILLASFFGVGLLLMLPVNETAGVRAAKRVEREHEKTIHGDAGEPGVTPL
ncbi:MAG: MFS transporter [Phycisphaerales bacterium JB040]